jgi:hypothetical protein
VDLDEGWFTVSENIGRGLNGGQSVDESKTETSE